MPYKGIVKGNVIILDEPSDLEEGAEVEIIPLNHSGPIDTIYGSWQDERTAEEIIKDIRSSRFTRDKGRDL